ncbi:hypothetical protein BESB_077210 [Besnoitia besnoiti]|uniref:CS domain-containing protein n=1 Tax=Besnoitia besnoiti TaxID=94643 RepID=A0A2A9M8K9_BESBE|nr:hypothetical protein BESB_077210 [Besnoitia besnoiti]PFH33504.1 hypothetical protein BESB_077210 [Besnoitia besnoiti]
MVDYSKWDKMEVSSSEDEEASPSRPRVRRFEEKQRVTLGPEGLSIEGQEETRPPRKKLEELDYDDEDIDLEGDTAAEEAFEDAHEWPRCGHLPQSPSGSSTHDARAGIGLAPAPAAEPAGAGSSASAARAAQRRDETLLIENGGVVEGRYFWSQTRHEVVVDVLLPKGARGKDLKVELRTDSCCCTYKGTAVLSGAFPHTIEEDEDMWFWELVEKKINWKRLARLAEKVNSGRDAEGRQGDSKPADAKDSEDGRQQEGAEKSEGKPEDEGEDEVAPFLELSLRKKPEVAGTYVWWNCVVKGDPCVDVEKLPGRAAKETTTQSFKEAWEKAHQMFLEKLKNERREPMEI